MKKLLSLLLAVVMIISIVPAAVFAASVEYDETVDDYYNVISKDDYELAPGIVESEIVLNNDAGTHRQVAHVVEIDINNEYTKVMPSYKGMAEGLESADYGVQVMSEQAAYAEANGYGNVVAAMNLSLSWYTSSYYSENPELYGEPLGYLVMDGVYYENSQGKTSGAQTCLVINFDEKDGEARPSDIPKTEIRSTSSAITGWEEQVIPANFGFLVKDGVNQYSVDNNASNGASRSFVGIKEDGTIVMVMNDGRQSPYSAGFTSYEMAQFMISLGCVQAINGDGGGSSCFLSQRPGEELELNCSPSDGAERATTHGILVISTAPATGEFVRAQITTEDKYYTPGSSVQFNAIGSDLVGTSAEIPADAVWQLTDSSFGTIDNNGLFTSNGTTGDVTAQLVYNGEVVGEASVTIVLPEISFKQDTLVLPYGESVALSMNVTTNGGLNTVSTKAGDIVFTLSDAAMGSIEGNVFTTTSDTAVTGGTITAVICGDTENAVTADVKFGKASEIVYDYEDGQLLIDTEPEVDPAEGEPYGWFIRDTRSNGYFAYRFFAKKSYTPVGLDIPAEVYLVDKDNGEVKNGNYAMGIDIDWTNVTASCHGQVDVFLPESLDVTDATSVGFWMYIPAELVTASMQIRAGFLKTDGGSTAVTANVTDMMGANSGVENGGWFYFSWEVLDTYKTFEYFQINSHYTAGEGNYNYYQDVTFYVDDVTVDYSDATSDRENPYFADVTISNGDSEVSVTNGYTVSENVVTLFAQAYENTAKSNYTGLNLSSAKVTVDGVPVTENVTVAANGKVSVVDLQLSDGVHTVVVEISDNQGNVGNIVRKIVVNTEKSAVRLEVPSSDALLPTDSIYWLNLVADDLAAIDSVTTTINLDYVNDWELEGMEVAYGFTAEYYINNHNDAVITFTRTGTEIADTTILAKLPVRIWTAKGWLDDSGVRADYISDDPTKQDKYYILTPHAMWYSDGTRDYRLVVSAEAGVVTYVDGSTQTFSANETVIQTEMNRYYTNSDKQGKWSFHIHTAGEAQDLAATCTTAGYTGRVFCVGCACGAVENLGTECDTHAGCGSVVEWGTIIPATGHNYEVEDGVLTCTGCDKVYNGVLDGKTYIDGVIASGWVNDTYYYVDGVALTGSNLIDGTMYTFDESGVYLPDYVYDGWFEINDTVMYFVSNTYLTGPNKLNNEYYNFDANGMAFDGEVVLGGQTCLFDNGVSVETDTVLLAGMCGEKAEFVIYQDGRMVISGEGDMVDYKSVGSLPWYANHRYQVKSLYIGKDITSVGVRAFYNLYYLESVTFEEGSVLKSIDGYGFGLNSKLTEVILPETVTYIGEPAFRNCVNLTNVYIPAGVTFIGPNAFYLSTNVNLNVAEGSYAESYAISKGIAYTTYEAPAQVIATGVSGDTTWTYDSKGVLTVSGEGAMADYDAKGTPWEAYRTQIKKVVIGEGVTYVGKFAFYYCSSLSEIVFAENGALETIGWGSFGYCNKLTSVTLPASVKTLNGYAFYFCTNLADVSFASGSSLESIEQYAFKGDTGLENFYVPDGVTLIGPGAFLNCQETATFNVAEGSYAHDYFANNNIVVREAIPVVLDSGVWGDTTWTYNNLGVLTISGNGAMADCETKSAPWEAYRTRIKKVVIGEGVTYIGKFNFYYMSSLTEIEFAENGALETIGWGAFGYCRALTSVTLPASIKTLNGYAMYYCTNLTDVSFAEGSMLRTISQYAFKKDTALQNVYIPDGVTVIGAGAFEGSQTTATFYVAENSYAHNYFASNNIVVREAEPVVLERGTWGDTTWTFDNGGVLTVSGNGAMADCAVKSAPWESVRTQIKKVVIGEGVTYIGKFNFYYCNNLTEIEFAENGALETIGWGSFGYCRALTSVTLPASVEVVDSYAFYYCSNLATFGVAEGSNLTSIGQYAFKADSALTSVSIPEGTTIGAGAFLDTPIEE